MVLVAFAARTQVGDPAYIKNEDKLAEVITKEYAARVRLNITDVGPVLMVPHLSAAIPTLFPPSLGSNSHHRVLPPRIRY